MNRMTKEEFIEHCRSYFGGVTAAQVASVRPCDCGSDGCNGWRIDPGEDRDGLFVFNPPIVRV